MSQQYTLLKVLSLPIGAVFATSLACSAMAGTPNDNNANPFAMHNAHEANSKIAEMPKDGECGTGKCSADMINKPKNAKCGGAKPQSPKQAKCGGK